MSTVSARFWIPSITLNASGYVTVKMQPALRGEENKAWASATPVGSIELGVGNPEAVAWFQERLGKDLAITFADRPADELPAQ